MANAETIRHAALDLAINGAAEFKQSMGEINRALKASQAELNKVTSAYAKNEQNVETLTAQKTHLNNAIELNRAEQARLNEELQRATEQYGENSREAQVLATKLANAEAKGNGLQRQLDDVTTSLEEQERALRGLPWTELGQKMEAAGAKMQAVGDRMQKVGKGLSLAVTAPILAIGAAAIAVGADFDNSMSTIQARTGMTAEETAKLGAAFREMGVNGNYSAREIAAAFAGIAVAGQDVEHSTEIMRTSMVLAAAVGDDLGATAYFLGNYLLKAGKDASYAEQYINQFAATNQKTGIGLATLQNYLFRANVTLQATNISGAEASAMFGALYQAGVRGAQAYSGVEAATRALLNPTDDMIAALDKLGIAREYDNGQLRDGIPFLMDVAAALSELEGGYLAYYSNVLGATQAGAAFLGGIVDVKDNLPDMIADIQEAGEALDGTGRAFEMAAIQQEGFTATMNRIRNTLESVKLQIADHILPTVERFVEGTARLVERFASLDEGTQRTIIKFAGIAAAIGPALIVKGKLISTVGKVTTAYGKAATAIGAAGGAQAALTAKLPLGTKAIAAYSVANAALLKNIAAVKAGTTSFTAAFSLKKTAMTGFTAVSKLVTGGLAAVKAGFIKLKAVMLANPLGLVVAGVAALAAGIAALIIRVNRVSEAYQEMGEETDRLIARQNQLADASASAAEQFQQNTAQMQDHNKHVNEMAEAVERLANQQELTAGEMQILERYISELNKSVPGLALAFDDYTGALNMSVDALNAYIRAAEKRAALDAKIEERMRLEREAIELQREWKSVTEQREALEEKLNDGSNRRRADRRALEEQIQELIAAEWGYHDAHAANLEMQAALTYGIETYSQALADLERQQQDTAQAAYDIAEAMDGTADAVDNASAAMERHGITMEEWEKAQQDALARINQSYERYYAIAANAFRTVEESAAVSIQSMTQNLQDNARAVEEWSKNIAILVERGVDEGLIQQLRDGGVEMAATVRELVNASDDELDALNDAFEESTRVALESMQRELDPTGVAQSAGELIDKVADAILSNQSMEEALVNQINTAFDSLSDAVATVGFDEAGVNAVEGFTGGIDSMQGDVTQAGTDTGENYLDGLKSGLESNSPSRATQREGVNAGEGLIKGTRDVEQRVVDTAKDLARAFIRGIASTIDQSPDVDNSIRRQVEDMRRIADAAVMSAHFDSVGLEMANGVARGIQGGGGIVSNAAQNMINNALSAMRAAAAISSPSRKSMEIADRIGDGLIIRMKAKGKELVEVCKAITDKVMESLYVDPSELINSSKSIIDNMQNTLPTVQSHIHKVTSPQPPAPPQGKQASGGILITGNQFVIREESDITKVAKEVMKLINEKVEDEGWDGGVVLV